MSHATALPANASSLDPDLSLAAVVAVASGALLDTGCVLRSPSEVGPAIQTGRSISRCKTPSLITPDHRPEDRQAVSVRTKRQAFAMVRSTYCCCRFWLPLCPRSRDAIAIRASFSETP